VILGDSKTTLNIHGIGQIKCLIGTQTLIINNVHFVPDLAESIYSLFLLIKQQQHGIQSSYDDGLHLKFPNFTTKTIVGSADIYLDAIPHPDNPTTASDVLCSMSGSSISDYCHHTVIQENDIEHNKDKNLLQSLRQYYSEVKTKRQLNLNRPAGFRSSSTLQKDYNIFNPPCKARSEEILQSSDHTTATTTIANATPSIITLSSMDLT
jgi:hypothetical protein